MTLDELDSVLAAVRRLRTGFAATAPQPWTATTAAAEITVQCGHLAQCLLRRWGEDTSDLDDPLRPITRTGDELADVVLAGLSVPVLAEVHPHTPPPPAARSGSEVALYLRVLVAVGQLAEAAMIHDGARHQPTGAPPSIPAASARTVTVTTELAERLGLNLLAEFRAMARDAQAFLSSRDITP